MGLPEQLHRLGAGSGPRTRSPAAATLGGLTDAALASLESELSYVRLKSGDMLFAAGDPGDALYIVAFGRLRAVIEEGPHGQKVLGDIGRGESVGEMALLTGERRSASVFAVRDTALTRLTKAAFDRLVERHPQVLLEMSRLIVGRYQRVLQPSLPTAPAAIAVVPADPGIPVADVAASLERALSPGRRVLSVDPDRLQRERGVPGDGRGLDCEAADLAGWLEEQELQHDFLIYIADAPPSAWTRFCLRQADIVLLVGAGRATALHPDLLPRQAAGVATGARRELVLLYDSGQRPPCETAEWLAVAHVSAHHHLDPRRASDYERLARMLTGRAIGLVLGGGGARGLAHIGVIRALEEARIPIDLVGGTSSGSIIAGQYASGWESARILAESRRVLIQEGSLNDYTLPLIALLRGNRYIRMLQKLFADRWIEDLPLAFFCVSTNLTRSTCMVHRLGLLYKAVAASCAVPGLGPPRADGRDILVDGGVLNNLPVDIMRDLGRGPVFASSVSPRADLCLDREYLDFPSPWRVLASWFNPFGTPMLVPSIGTILMRTVSLQQGTAENPPDLLIEPPGGRYKLLDWHALDAIVETGYRAAVPALERWQAGQPDAAQTH